MSTAPTDTGARAAVCLHGFLRTGLSMMMVARHLRRCGWTTVNSPTHRYELVDMAEIGAQVARRIRQASTEAGGVPVDVITHSMGGLALRAALAHAPPIHRAVMLAPPNQGAEMAARWRARLPLHQLGWDPFRALLPENAPALPTPNEHPVDIGILIGGTGATQGFNPFLDGDNDGKVRLVEAQLPGAREVRTVNARHPAVVWRPDVLDLAVRFLRTGTFGDADADGHVHPLPALPD